MRHSERSVSVGEVALREGWPRHFVWRVARFTRDEGSVVASVEEGHPKSVLRGETEKASSVWRAFSDTAANGCGGDTQVEKNSINTGLVGKISRI